MRMVTVPKELESKLKLGWLKPVYRIMVSDWGGEIEGVITNSSALDDLHAETVDFYQIQDGKINTNRHLQTIGVMLMPTGRMVRLVPEEMAS